MRIPICVTECLSKKDGARKPPVPSLNFRGRRTCAWRRRGRNPVVKNGWALRGFLRLFLVTGVFFLEPFHTACNIHDLLLPRDEGMTLGTDFRLDVLTGGSRFDHIPADAGNGGFLIFRMNTFFHD
jgi:hypothetical protein